MADTGIFATTAEVQRKVGANASATANTEAYINQYMTEAESLINMATGVNWSDIYSTLNVDKKGVLKLAASSKAAMLVLNYDTAAMTAREAETRLDVLRDDFYSAFQLLKDSAAKDFVAAA